tara:strand:- start:356 stop:706 length:351 start_codon:yes stop_codon:yes gene_type:complete
VVILYLYKDILFLLDLEEALLVVTQQEITEDQVNLIHLMAPVGAVEVVEIQMRVDQEDLEAEADREVQRALEMLEVTHHQKETQAVAEVETKVEVEEAQQTLEVTLFMVLVVTEEV